MSIWCSRPHVGFELHWEPDPDEDHPQGGQVRTYVDGWSNHFPTTDGDAEQEAMIDTAHIAPWCTPGWENREAECQMMAGPWLRLSVSGPRTEISRGAVKVGQHHLSVSVVLDEAAVDALIADLIEWRDTPKTRPIPDVGT